jgi:hypothetical protein
MSRGFTMSINIHQMPANLLDPRVESLPSPPVAEADYGNRLDGVIIPVWVGDVYLAKACCASVRQSMGDIPITLLVDGPATNTREIQRIHGVQRMVVQEVAGTEFLQLCTGTPWTKLLPFWLSPYERFLCIDADTLTWGDVRAYADFDRYDFIAAYNLQRRCLQTDAEVQKYVFDVETIRKRNPPLDWHGREFANSGFFFARRGVFSETQLMALRRWDCWRCYDQGLLNYLRWQAEFSGSPRVGGERVQVFPAEREIQVMDRFLPRDFHQPAIVHWVGKKPKLGRPFRAANDYRKMFLEATGRKTWLTTRLFIEDTNVWLQRHRRSLARRLRGETKK